MPFAICGGGPVCYAAVRVERAAGRRRVASPASAWFTEASASARASMARLALAVAPDDPSDRIHVSSAMVGKVRSACYRLGAPGCALGDGWMNVACRYKRGIRSAPVCSE